MYKLSDVKLVCESIYGRKLKKRAWIYWKRKACISRYQRAIDNNQLERLLTLAYLKRKEPYKEFTLEYLISQKSAVLKEHYLKKHSYQEYIIPNECYGRQLPGIINVSTGRNTSIKSLYRIGKTINNPFSLNKKYGKNEMLTYISAFS